MPLLCRLRNRLGDTELSLIVHDIKDVNQQLEKGFYFFRDVKSEGIALYDSPSPRFLRTENLIVVPERLPSTDPQSKPWLGGRQESTSPADFAPKTLSIHRSRIVVSAHP
jgi:hypothetical protein